MKWVQHTHNETFSTLESIQLHVIMVMNQEMKCLHVVVNNGVMCYVQYFPQKWSRERFGQSWIQTNLVVLCLHLSVWWNWTVQTFVTYPPDSHGISPSVAYFLILSKIMSNNCCFLTMRRIFMTRCDVRVRYTPNEEFIRSL